QENLCKQVNDETKEEEPEDWGSEAGEVEGGTGPSEEEIIEEPKEEKIEEIKELEEKQDIALTPKQPTKITSSVVYESKAQENSNLPLLLLLAVSISLNVLFIFSKVSK
ncbi:hypothetical protein HOB30_05290, partial [Candidatus Falkowbacteria bacterium]|nr:hypothetical protein [Candidatus Falkowbacteria bacterium]